MNNLAIREEAISHDVKFWEIAERMGIWPEEFSRIMRHEIEPYMQDTIMNIIQEIAKTKNAKCNQRETNAIIRKEARKKGVHQWEIAERLGMNEQCFSRKLRHELSDEEREKVLIAINEISKGGNHVHGRRTEKGK
jgi:predicted XRE-type DNA-binding protein